ncbi:hypothetical protein [Paenibacillus silvae]|nr:MULTISPECIES: hypothetical protein [Paenibacillus]
MDGSQPPLAKQICSLSGRTGPSSLDLSGSAYFSRSLLFYMNVL